MSDLLRGVFDACLTAIPSAVFNRKFDNRIFSDLRMELEKINGSSDN